MQPRSAAMFDRVFAEALAWRQYPAPAAHLPTQTRQARSPALLDRRSGRRRSTFAGGLRVRGLLFVSFDDACDAQEFIAGLERHEAHSFRAATGFANIFDGATDALAFRREQHDFVFVADAQRTRQPN